MFLFLGNIFWYGVVTHEASDAQLCVISELRGPLFEPEDWEVVVVDERRLYEDCFGGGEDPAAAETHLIWGVW